MNKALYQDNNENAYQQTPLTLGESKHNTISSALIPSPSLNPRCLRPSSTTRGEHTIAGLEQYNYITHFRLPVESDMEAHSSGLLELTALSVQSLFPRVNDDVYSEVHKFAIREVLHVLSDTSLACGGPLSGAVHTSGK
jgi:hypothetical protein